MGAIGDGNDIKIKVTLDTTDAVKSAEELKRSLEDTLKVTKSQFESLAKAYKDINAVRVAEIKAASAKEVAEIEAASREKKASLLAGAKVEQGVIASNVKIFEAAERSKTQLAQQQELTRRAFIQATGKVKEIQAQNDIAAARAASAKEVAEIEAASREKKASLLAGAKVEQSVIASNVKLFEAAERSKTQLAQQQELTRRAFIQATGKVKEIQAQNDIAAARIELANIQSIEKEKQRAFAQTYQEQQKQLVLLRNLRRGGGDGVDTSKLAASSVGAGKELSGFLGTLSKLSGALTGAASGIFILNQAFGAIAGAVGGAIKLVSGLVSVTARLADAGSKVEGLRSGFETLQRAVGVDPANSIEKLRTATQGLVSDLELYQRANQAVLLNIPTPLFNEAAEAAVKLGRAMGIDAAFALESLSLGLGRNSRLYLDNLGIIVSATKAYENFARQNNKSAEDLTDAEKRLAFFNETSKALRDGLSQLPEIQDTAGIGFERLKSTSSNLTTSFLEGFNRNKDLADSFNNINEIIKTLGPAFVTLGDRVAGFISAVANNAPVKAFAGYLRDIADSAERTFGSSLEGRIFRANEALEKAQSNLQGFQSGTGAGALPKSKFTEALGFTEEYYKKQVELAQDAVNKLNEEAAKPQPEIKVPLRVDNSQVENDIADTTALINSTLRETQESLGVFKIPGIDQKTLDPVRKQLTSVFLEIEQKSISADVAASKINALTNQLGRLATETNVQTTLAQIDVLNKANAESIAKTGQEIDGYEKSLKELNNQLEAQRNNLSLDAAQRKALNSVIVNSKNIAKKTYQELRAEITKTTKTTESEFKKQQKALINFSKGVEKALDTDVPKEYQEKLFDIFKQLKEGRISAETAESSFEQLGAQFQKSGGDTNDLAKELKDLVVVAKEAENIGAPLSGVTAQGQAVVNQSRQSLNDFKNLSFDARQALKSLDVELGDEGAFFGFDIGGVDVKGESELAQTLQSTLRSALQFAVEGVTREDAPELGRVIGTTVGAAIGAYFGDPATGAQVGGVIGEVFGTVFQNVGNDGPGTRERKAIDKYFADLFEGGKLGVILSGELITGLDFATGEFIREAQTKFVQISDLVFEGVAAFGGSGFFGGEGFTTFFDTLTDTVKAGFEGIGLAFGLLNGIAIEESRLIGVALSNNIGGSLNNLQILIQATGESLEDLSQSVIDAFLNSEITIEEAYNSLLQLQTLFQKGIPGAVGNTEEAFSNLLISLEQKQPGRIVIDALQDIAVEADEASRSFGSTIAELGQRLGFGAQQTQILFQLLRNAGITSLAQLASASETTILSILNGIRQVQEGTISTIEQVNALPILPDIKAPTTPSGGAGAGRSRGESEAQRRAKQRKEELKRQREEIFRLLIESQKYANILTQINKLELDSIAGGKAINALRREIANALKNLNSLESAYQKELAKGDKANQKRLSDLAKQFKEAQKTFDDLTKKVGNTTEGFKQLDLKGVIPLIKDVNNLAVVARQAGVQLEKNVDILIKGFLQGRLTLSELNAEINKTKDLLGPGIPNAVGDVTQAFQNLIDAGTKGGQFSVDAFVDIFAEFREKFEKESSALRESERTLLVNNLEQAKRAFAEALGPEQTEAARKALQTAEKALQDFYDKVQKPELGDLRKALEDVFGPEQVALFFRALDESGLSTFEDFEKAGIDSIVKILARLEELGFQFNETSKDIIDANKGLQDAEKEANNGLDPLAEAIKLVKEFNAGASTLPPAFNDTTNAINNLNGPLSRLSASFDNVVEKLALLSGLEFKNDIIFNVRTTGEQGARQLVEILFGDGSDIGTNVGNGGGGGGGATGGGDSARRRKQSRLKFLRRKKSKTAKDIAEIKRLQSELGG